MKYVFQNFLCGNKQFPLCKKKKRCTPCWNDISSFPNHSHLNQTLTMWYTALFCIPTTHCDVINGTCSNQPINQTCSIYFYYPSQDVFALNMGKYRWVCIFFVYTSILWIISVNSFQFFTNILETICPTYMYHISLERLFFYSASAHVCCIKIHGEIKELLQAKD